MKAKKSLGQNFLTSKKAIETIVSSSGVSKNDYVLEIGPGKGVLTSALLFTGAKVIAVEKDNELVPFLSEKFSEQISSGQLVLIHADILDCNLEEIVPKEYLLIANIPYYITGQIIRMFLETNHQPKSITVLVQKEVADRMVAKDKKESLLSLSIKAYGVPKYIEKVPRGAFNPSPNVDSAIIHIGNISKNNFADVSEKKFFEVLHYGFAHKRKQILPNLAEHYEKEKIIKALNDLDISTKSRAEDIEIGKWLNFCKEI